MSYNFFLLFQILPRFGFPFILFERSQFYSVHTLLMSGTAPDVNSDEFLDEHWIYLWLL